MNKTLLRALPVVGIFALIIAIVAIFSLTNINTPIAEIEGANEVVYSFEATEGDFNGKNFTVTKGELYQYLRYNQSFNTVITKHIDEQVLSNGTKNYFDVVKADDESVDAIKKSIKQAVTGSYSDDLDIASKMTEKSIIKAAKQFKDSMYTTYGIEITVDVFGSQTKIDYVDALVNQAYSKDAIFKNYAMTYAKKFFAKDILGDWNVEDKYDDTENPLYLEADAIAEKAEAIFDNEKTGAIKAYGLFVEFTSKKEFQTSVEAVQGSTKKFTVESDILVYDNGAAGGKVELTQSALKTLKTTNETLYNEIQKEVLNLYIKLYDFKYAASRHRGEFSLETAFTGKTIDFTTPEKTAATVTAVKDVITNSNKLYYKVTKSGHPEAGKKNTACGTLEKNEVCLNYLAVDSNTATSTASAYNDYIFSSTKSTLGVADAANNRTNVPFTTEGTKLFATNRVVVFNVSVDESMKDAKYSKLTDEEKAPYIAKVRENMFDSTLSTSYINEKYTDALKEVDVTIFDQLVQKSYANANSFLSTKKDTSSTVVFKIGNTEYKPLDLYNELFKTNAASALLTIVEEKLVEYSPLYTYTYSDKDAKKEVEEELKNVKISFSLADSSNRSCPELPSNYGWSDYIKNCFQVSDEKALLKKLELQKIQGNFTNAYFTATEYEDREDAKVHNIKNVLDFEADGAYAELAIEMEALKNDTELIFNGLSSVSAKHLLVSLRKVNGSDSDLVAPQASYVGETPKDATAWTTEQVATAEKLIAEVSKAIGTTFEDFDKVITAFNDAKFGCTESAATCKTISSTKGEEFKNIFGYAKQLGLALKTEDLGSFQKGSMVHQFEDRVIDLLKANPTQVTDFIMGEKGTILDKNHVATAFGYHLIQITGVTQVASAKIDMDEINKFNIGKLENYKLDSTFVNTDNCKDVAAVCIPSYNQLARYNKLVHDELLQVKLPTSVQTAIEFYYGGVKSKRLSSNMVSIYVIESFIMGTVDANGNKFKGQVNEAMAKELNTLKAIYAAKANNYNN